MLGDEAEDEVRVGASGGEAGAGIGGCHKVAFAAHFGQEEQASDVWWGAERLERLFAVAGFDIAIAG